MAHFIFHIQLKVEYVTRVTYTFRDIYGISIYTTYNSYIVLTVILPTPKVISLFHQYRPGSILLADHLQVFILMSLKLIMDSAKNVGKIWLHRWADLRKLCQTNICSITSYRHILFKIQPSMS